MERNDPKIKAILNNSLKSRNKNDFVTTREKTDKELGKKIKSNNIVYIILIIVNCNFLINQRKNRDYLALKP